MRSPRRRHDIDAPVTSRFEIADAANDNLGQPRGVSEVLQLFGIFAIAAIFIAVAIAITASFASHCPNGNSITIGTVIKLAGC